MNEKAQRPKVQTNINWESVVKICEEHMDNHFNNPCGDKEDADHYIYEAVMRAIYGKNVWQEFNKRYKEFGH